MSQMIRAVYENGVLRPLDELKLNEHQQVQLIVEPDAAATDDPLDGLRISTGISDLAEQFDDYRYGARTP